MRRHARSRLLALLLAAAVLLAAAPRRGGAQPQPQDAAAAAAAPLTCPPEVLAATSDAAWFAPALTPCSVSINLCNTCIHALVIPFKVLGVTSLTTIVSCVIESLPVMALAGIRWEALQELPLCIPASATDAAACPSDAALALSQAPAAFFEAARACTDGACGPPTSTCDSARCAACAGALAAPFVAAGVAPSGDPAAEDTLAACVATLLQPDAWVLTAAGLDYGVQRILAVSCADEMPSLIARSLPLPPPPPPRPPAPPAPPPPALPPPAPPAPAAPPAPYAPPAPPAPPQTPPAPPALSTDVDGITGVVTVTLSARVALSASIAVPSGATYVVQGNALYCGGGACELDAGGAFRHFTVATGATLTLRGVRLVHGVADAYGGGTILADAGSAVTLEDGSSISGCRSPSFGGCIFTHGALTLRDAELFDCAAVDGGGAVAGAPGSVIVMERVMLRDSAASGGVGGCVAALGALSITDSKLKSCSASTDGGLIYTGESAATPALLRTEMTEGGAGGSGGCVYAAGDVSVTSCALFLCTAAAHGGAVWAGGEARIAAGSIISYNSATSGAGGGIFSGSGGALSVDKATFLGNTAALAGGCVYVAPGAAAPTNISNALLRHCVAAYGGGGVYASAGALSVASSLFDNNDGGDVGGALLLDAGALSLRGCAFVGNRALQSGGALAAAVSAPALIDISATAPFLTMS
jgi:hypothetical protein